MYNCANRTYTYSQNTLIEQSLDYQSIWIMEVLPLVTTCNLTLNFSTDDERVIITTNKQLLY